MQLSYVYYFTQIDKDGPSQNPIHQRLGSLFFWLTLCDVRDVWCIFTKIEPRAIWLLTRNVYEPKLQGHKEQAVKITTSGSDPCCSTLLRSAEQRRATDRTRRKVIRAGTGSRYDEISCRMLYE